MFPNDRRVLLAISLLVLSTLSVLAEPLSVALDRAANLTKRGEDLGIQQKVDDAIAAFQEASAC